MSLFAGIGGFDLAAEWMGWQTVVQVELDEWCRKVLAKNFPNATRHDDIKTFDGRGYLGAIDLICGGFPCQPYSSAGKRLGKEDDRHLWPDMYRVIREVRPRYVVGENVPGLLTWNGGLVFNEVLSDLEAEGYQTQSFVIPACGVDAPHKRDRVWIVAHASGSGGIQYGSSNTIPNGDGVGSSQKSGWIEFKVGPRGSSSEWPATNTKISDDGRHFRESQSGQIQQFGIGIESKFTANSNSEFGPQGRLHETGPETTERHISPCDARNNGRTGWENFPTQPPLRTGNDGVSVGLDPTRTIKGAGNAVSPQVVYQLFQAIAHLNHENA